jgi:hypothetical protein
LRPLILAAAALALAACSAGGSEPPKFVFDWDLFYVGNEPVTCGRAGTPRVDLDAKHLETGKEEHQSFSCGALGAETQPLPAGPYSVVIRLRDAQNRLVAMEELFRGTLTQTSVYPREVVLRALSHQAASVVLAHNHPSGTVQPSRADEALTQTLKAALALVDGNAINADFGAGTVQYDPTFSFLTVNEPGVRLYEVTATGGTGWWDANFINAATTGTTVASSSTSSGVVHAGIVTSNSLATAGYENQLSLDTGGAIIVSDGSLAQSFGWDAATTTLSVLSAHERGMSRAPSSASAST